MAGPIRLRSRMRLLNAAFALVLIGITFVLSWRAHVAQEKWSLLVGVETQAIATLEELIRAQNAYSTHAVAGNAEHYRIVTQLLESESLSTVDTVALRRSMSTFRVVLTNRSSARGKIRAESLRVVAEAQRMIDERKRGIARQLPVLERESRELMSAGLAVAWIVVIFSIAAVRVTEWKVVRPLEDLVHAAQQIADGDLLAKARVAGDYEIAILSNAVNHMAEQLKARARTDELTNLPNFRAFRERIDGAIERAGRYPERFGILILDLDRFKKYNDTYGHLAGNDALQRVSHVIREALRTVDFPARYGGEEFAVIVPQIDHAALTAIAERIRESVERMPAPEGGARLTVSIGAAIFPDDGGSVDVLFRAADERLYAAKHAGRNRVVVGGVVAGSRSFEVAG